MDDVWMSQSLHQQHLLQLLALLLLRQVVHADLLHRAHPRTPTRDLVHHPRRTPSQLLHDRIVGVWLGEELADDGFRELGIDVGFLFGEVRVEDAKQLRLKFCNIYSIYRFGKLDSL
jgi:hypothetical protein